jgi:hypothetical protein
MRLYGPSADAVTAAESLLDDMVTPITTYHTSTSAQISGAAKLSFIKLNAIGTDGHYISPSTNEHIVADVAGGGVEPQPHPNQVALAISLVTGFSRGPAHRGRFFMPLPVFPLDAAGLISTEHRDFAKTAATTLITSINATNIPWKLGVFSRKAGAAGHRAITGIEVGRVYDTQRRRRRSMAELY